VDTGPRAGDHVRGSPLTVDRYLHMQNEYISWSYSRSSQVICITPIHALQCYCLEFLSGIYQIRVLIELVGL
jgi:hypothetical protein